MRHILKKYLIMTISVYLLMQIIPALTIERGWRGLLYSCLILSLLMYIAKPIINLLLLPISLLSLNLVSWLVNILIVYVWTVLVSDVQINPWQFQGLSFYLLSLSPFYFASWQTVVLMAIMLTVIIQIFRWILK